MNGNVKWLVGVALFVVPLLIYAAIYVAETRSIATTNRDERVRIDVRLIRIEDKLDRLIERGPR